MKNAWGICEGDLFCSFRDCDGGAGTFRRLLKKQKSWQAPFPSPGPSLGTWTLVATSTGQTFSLANRVTCPLQFVLSVRVHPKWCHKHGIVQAADRGQHHSKVTPVPGRGGDNHTHQFDYDPNCGLGADIWSDCKPHPPKKPPTGQCKEGTLKVSRTTSLANSWSDPTQA